MCRNELDEVEGLVLLTPAPFEESFAMADEHEPTQSPLPRRNVLTGGLGMAAAMTQPTIPAATQGIPANPPGALP